MGTPRSSKAQRATPPVDKAKPSKPWAKLSRRSYLRASLDQAELAAENAISGGSWQGAAMFKRLAKGYREELDELAAAEAEARRLANLEGLSSRMAVAATEMSETQLEIFVREYLDRTGARLVVDGGRVTA